MSTATADKVSKSTYAEAARLRDAIRKIVRTELEEERPAYRYGVVKTIDRENHKCEVLFETETTYLPVSMGSLQPADVEQVVRVDGLRGDRYVSDVIGDVFLAGTAGASNPYRIDLFGASVDLADNTDAVNACIAACAAGGGGTCSFPFVLPGLMFDIAGRVVFVPGAGLIGLGPEASIFNCTTSTAGVDFGLGGTGSAAAYGAACGNFAVNGGNVAINPMVINQCVQRTFYNFFARFADPNPASGSAALLMYGTQNCHIDTGQIFGGAAALRLDGGAANNMITKCELGGGTLHDLAFRAGLTSPAGQLPYTFSNTVMRCVMEWTESTTKNMVVQTGGSGNSVIFCDIRSNAHFGGSPPGSLPTAMDALIMTDLTEYASFSTMVVHDCFMAGYNAPLQAAIWATTGTEINVEGGVIGQVPYAFKGGVRMQRPPQLLGTVTAAYQDKPFAERRSTFTDITAGPTDIINGCFVIGGAHLTYYDDAMGIRRYGDGTNNVDCGFGRLAAGMVGPIAGTHMAFFGTWNTSHEIWAGYHKWMNPAVGKFYVKAGVPTSATDGVVIGPP